MSSREQVNEYEALRLAKIARNEARLRELGLLKTPTTTPAPKARATVRVSPENPVNLPLRRSKRTRKAIRYAAKGGDTKTPRRTRSQNDELEEEADRIDMDYNPMYEDTAHLDDETTVQKTRKTSQSNGKTGSLIRKSPPAASMPPNSARTMKLTVTKLLDDHDIIGQTLSKTGKAYVMEESARLAVDSYDGTSSISFNKYSGVQEWGNKVLFLWINLGAPNSEVTNDFPNGGRQVTWFGGSRMHEGTPVIQRLLAVGKQATKDDGNGVVLWCRRYVKERKTFEPYTCLGRLSYVSHEPQSHPLLFVWKLVDFDRICNHADMTRRKTFQSMLQKS